MKHRKKIVLMAGAACAILGICGLLAVKTGAAYQMKDTVSRLFASAELKTVDIETRGHSLADLLADDRVTFDQSGMLVNLSNRLPDGFEADISQYKDTGVLMNSAMLEDYALLSQRISDLFGQKLYIRSSYRTAEQQAQVIEEEGEKAIAVGASEHQTGLALDVYVRSFAGKAFLKSPVGRWVNSTCWEYGFIIRYPYYRENVDGIGYEPWHLRYVGKPHAEIIYKNSLTLEDYFFLLADGQWREFEGCRISRQAGEDIQLPLDFARVTVSPDNTGGYLVSVYIEETKDAVHENAGS